MEMILIWMTKIADSCTFLLHCLCRVGLKTELGIHIQVSQTFTGMECLIESGAIHNFMNYEVWLQHQFKG